jgi:superfamily I DNA/RNA helicase
VKDAIAYIKAAVRPEESSAEIVRVMQRFVYDIRQSDISRFNSYAYRKGMDLYEALSHLDEIQVEREKFMVLKSVLDSLIKSGRERKVLDFVHGLLFETDFYRFEIALENKRNVSLLNQFYRMAAEFCRLYPDGSLLDFSDYMSLASNFEVQEEDVQEGAVTISTIHGVKGMQFPIVIIPDAVERKLPTTYMRDKFQLPSDLIKGVKSEFDEKELHLQEERRCSTWR